MLKTTGINIRKAVEDDVLDCLMLFKQFHKESKLPYSWDAKKTQALFLQTLPMEEIETFVAEIDGDVVGFIVCQVMEPLFSSDRHCLVCKQRPSEYFRRFSTYESL